MEWKDLSISDQQIVKQGVYEYFRPADWQDGKDPSVCMGEGKPYVLIEGKSSLTCFYTYRSHTNSRQYVKLDEYGVAYCCHNEGCRKQPTKRNSYRELQNGATLQKIVLRMLYGEQSTVNKSVAKARQNLQDSIYTGSTTGLKCNLVNNKLVAPVKEKSELHTMWAVLHRFKQPDCRGQPITVTSSSGLEVYCDVCNTRTPDLVIPLASSTAPSTTVLTQYFTQINDNLTITTKNYYGGDVVDAKFDQVENIFPDDPELIQELYRNTSWNWTGDIKDVWWTFTGVGWVKETNDVEIFCKTRVVDYYTVARAYYQTHTTDPKLKKYQTTRFDSIIKGLETPRDRLQIMHEAATEFKAATPDFEALLDANKDFLGFTNGVYDLNRCEFRPALSTDYLTFNTEYALPSTKCPETQAQLETLFETIFADEATRRYMLKFLASTLDGYNKEEIFTIWTGTGRNGKGVLTHLLEAALGLDNGYMHNYQITLLTTERPSSSSPIPDLMNLKGKRLIMGSEPEKSSVIKAGMLKFLTGNDTISGRALYSNTDFHFKPQHSLVIQCNRIPKLDADDDAVWRRCRMIEFKHVFVDNPTGPLERKIDRSLKGKVKGWGPQFMLMLLDWYKIYKVEGLNPSSDMLVTTETIRNKNDPIRQWFSERVVESTSNIHCTQLFEDFASWIQTEWAGNQALAQDVLVPGKFKKYLREQLKLTLATVRVGDISTTGLAKRALRDAKYCRGSKTAAALAMHGIVVGQESFFLKYLKGCSKWFSVGCGNGSFEKAVVEWCGQDFSSAVRMSQGPYENHHGHSHTYVAGIPDACKIQNVDAQCLSASSAVLGEYVKQALVFNCPWVHEGHKQTTEGLLVRFLRSAATVQPRGSYVFVGITEYAKYFDGYNIGRVVHESRLQYALKSIDTGVMECVSGKYTHCSTKDDVDIGRQVIYFHVMLCFERMES